MLCLVSSAASRTRCSASFVTSVGGFPVDRGEFFASNQVQGAGKGRVGGGWSALGGCGGGNGRKWTKKDDKQTGHGAKETDLRSKLFSKRG